MPDIDIMAAEIVASVLLFFLLLGLSSWIKQKYFRQKIEQEITKEQEARQVKETISYETRREIQLKTMYDLYGIEHRPQQEGCNMCRFSKTRLHPHQPPLFPTLYERNENVITVPPTRRRENPGKESSHPPKYEEVVLKVPMVKSVESEMKNVENSQPNRQ